MRGGTRGNRGSQRMRAEGETEGKIERKIFLKSGAQRKINWRHIGGSAVK